jgi:tRNA U34 5-methylaminomethyl-2-thiouridine-forming methyltransferase MnmC
VCAYARWDAACEETRFCGDVAAAHAQFVRDVLTLDGYKAQISTLRKQRRERLRAHLVDTQCAHVVDIEWWLSDVLNAHMTWLALCRIEPACEHTSCAPFDPTKPSDRCKTCDTKSTLRNKAPTAPLPKANTRWYQVDNYMQLFTDTWPHATTSKHFIYRDVYLVVVDFPDDDE